MSDHSPTDTHALISAIYPPFAADLMTMTEVVQLHCAVCRQKGFTGENSTSMEDCALLYLLIRQFVRRHAFEIGTFIGTTAIAMNEAVRKNAGTLTTCDPKNCGTIPPESGICFINATADIALRTLCDEGRQIDFAFVDWLPDKATLDLLALVSTRDIIIAVHDYVPEMKGKLLVDALRNRPAGRWFLPDPAPVGFADGTRVNACTAFFIPNELLSGLPPPGAY
jgi:hypothetical protein